ncbi:MAG: ATP-binding protein, partial [Gammaproteobacteria bacterium]
MEAQDACARLHAEHPGARRWLVAFSGGLDSRVLLDLCHRYLAGRPDAPRLEALHVDHGVHADSARWARACAAICEALGIPFHLHRLQAVGRGEDALRRARYALFEQVSAEGDLLLLAHHRDDQAETVLLNIA